MKHLTYTAYGSLPVVTTAATRRERQRRLRLIAGSLLVLVGSILVTFVLVACLQGEAQHELPEGWRRTAAGWENTSQWSPQSANPSQPSMGSAIHPLLIALLLAFVSAGTLFLCDGPRAFPRPYRRPVSGVTHFDQRHAAAGPHGVPFFSEFVPESCTNSSLAGH